jgi:hypothetical protein
LGLGPVLAVAGGSQTESSCGSGWESDRKPVGAGREQDEEIGPVQTSTVHHDSETCNVRAVYYCVTPY